VRWNEPNSDGGCRDMRFVQAAPQQTPGLRRNRLPPGFLGGYFDEGIGNGFPHEQPLARVILRSKLVNTTSMSADHRPIGSWAGRRGLYGTRKGTLLESVRLGVTTSTFPVLAPAGTVVVIKTLDTTVNVAAVPLKVTLLAPVRSVPRILTSHSPK
jgi:hypothetical protein